MKLKSVLPVGVGLVFIIGVTTAVDAVLHATGVYPAWGEPLTQPGAVLALAYRIVISIAGACLTARLAPEAPMRHALVLGVVGLVLGTIGAVTTWNLDLGPRWYPVSLALLAIPQCWLGGRLYETSSTRP